MKIGVVVTEPITSGGGFNQALNAVSQIGRLANKRFDVTVYCLHADSLPLLKRLGFDAKFISIGLVDRLFSIVNVCSLFVSMLRHIVPKGKFERTLIKDSVDLVYFTSPCQYAARLCWLSYIITVWDLCHRDFPEFPEVSANGEFEKREMLYRAALPKAILILTDSKELAKLVETRYGIDSNRILPMPFAPSPFLINRNAAGGDVVLIKDEYFFYPAQFWPHKNHIRILEAVYHLKEQNVSVRVVFCGKDYGNLNWIREQASRFGVTDQIVFLGFVSPDEMNSLYDNCLAVLMPTYFGPTNLPPLEAWFKGKPLIYSKHLGGQARDAAFLIDPDSAESLASGMKAMLQSSVRDEYVLRGTRRLNEVLSDRSAAEEKFEAALLNFSFRRRLWK